MEKTEEQEPPGAERPPAIERSEPDKKNTKRSKSRPRRLADGVIDKSVATRLIPPIALQFGRSAIRRLNRDDSSQVAFMKPFVHNVLGSHSQYQEDLIIDAIYQGKKQGFYVDIGANDPVELNNTLRFYARGWSGINIEPLPKRFQELQNHRPRDINLNLAVGPIDGEMDFYAIDPDSLSTLNAKTAKANLKRPGARLITKSKIAVRRMETIFDQHLKDRSIDLMSLDVEGYESEVISSNNWSKYRPTLIIIEIAFGGEHIIRLMERNSYVLVYNNSANGLFFDEMSDLLDAAEIMKP